MSVTKDVLALSAEEARFLNAYAELPVHIRNFIRNGLKVFTAENLNKWGDKPHTTDVADRVMAILDQGYHGWADGKP